MHFRRHTGRPLCSPLPANPYAFVSGSKIFTQLPAVKCIFAGTPAGLFAPRCPQILMPSFRGAKASHSCRPINAFSPAHRPASLLPPARKSLYPRFGEQKPLQRFRTAAGVSLFLYSSAISLYPLCLHFHILIVGAQLIREVAFPVDFHNPVGNRADELVVM